MSKIIIYLVCVEFGDCDLVGIVYFFNFFCWYDVVLCNFFYECGVLFWCDMEKICGIIGMFVVDISLCFVCLVIYGDCIEVYFIIVEWNDKIFVMKYEIKCDGELLCEGCDVCVFVICYLEDLVCIKVIFILEDIREMCS